MELKEAFIQSVLEVCNLYKMQSQFKQDSEEKLIAANQVNVMISFTHTQKGKVIFEFNQDTALKIASVLLDQEVKTFFDVTVKKSIGEFTTFITRLAIGKMKVSSSIYFSDPILVTGNNIFGLISRSKANKLVFQMNDDLMILTYYIE
jgi:CheY-specific phosphatase CheX